MNWIKKIMKRKFHDLIIQQKNESDFVWERKFVVFFILQYSTVEGMMNWNETILRYGIYSETHFFLCMNFTILIIIVVISKQLNLLHFTPPLRMVRKSLKSNCLKLYVSFFFFYLFLFLVYNSFCCWWIFFLYFNNFLCLYF